jgi:hypothetical protein
MTVQASAVRVVVRFRDKRLLKGTTRDFAPGKPDFHLLPGGDDRAEPLKVCVVELKAVFFVKTFEGDRTHVEDKSFDRAKAQGRRIRVTFEDGEVLPGTTVGYAPNRPGFFLIPADPETNNERVFVVNAAVRKVEWVSLPRPVPAGAA